MGEGGRLVLDDTDLTVTDDVTVLGIMCTNAGRGCTPPVFNVFGAAQVNIGGSINLAGIPIVEVTGWAPLKGAPPGQRW